MASDYTKPRTNLNNILPAQLRSSFLTSLNSNLFNRFLTKDEYKYVVGLIGDSLPSSAYKNIVESDQFEQKNQLRPIAYAKVGSENYFLSFKDFLTRLSQLGVDTDQFYKWGKSQAFNFAPPIDIDKLINYTNYYWLAENPSEIPDYVTIKNLQKWSTARLDEYENSILNKQQPMECVGIDANSVQISGVSYFGFYQNSVVMLVDSDGTNSLNEIISIVPNSNEKTVFTFRYAFDRSKVSKVYSLQLPIFSVDKVNGTFSVVGDYSDMFTENYVFSTNGDNIDTQTTTLWQVSSSTFDSATNHTVIFVTSQIPDKTWTYISMRPMITLVQAEVDVQNSDSFPFIGSWNNLNLGQVIWYRDYSILSSQTGYSQLNSNNIQDNSYNFLALGVNAGDYLKILNGPNIGTYRIISVGNDYVGIESDKSFFSFQNTEYNIVKEIFYDYYSRMSAPPFPDINQIWVNPTEDALYQWNGAGWVKFVQNISLLVGATHQRYKLTIDQVDDWSMNNNWVHKSQLSSYSGIKHAQMPIIEFSPYLELSDTSYATYDWKYRQDSSTIYQEFNSEPLLFEIQDITNKWRYDAFTIQDQYSLVLNERYGNLTNELVTGYQINLRGFLENNGKYTVNSSKYVNLTPTGRYQTVVRFNEPLNNTSDRPLGSSVSPVLTSMGDPWLGFDIHWIFYGLKDLISSSFEPTPNPMIGTYVFSLVDTVNNYETVVNLYSQEYHLLSGSNSGSTLYFDSSLSNIVLFDDYQEGDIRVYINNVRQYGNYTDLRSLTLYDYVGGIQFNSSIVLTSNDIVRVELGEYSIDEIGRKAIPLVTQANLFDSTLPYNLTNVTKTRKIDQTKQTANVYPYFKVYDTSGNAVSDASNIFKYQEGSTYPIDPNMLRRIVHNVSSGDFGFEQLLSDATSGDLYCFKNLSQSNAIFQTVWARGNYNEQYVPSKLDDGNWDLPLQWFYNIDHQTRNDVMLSELYSHFNSIIAAQSIPGIASTNLDNKIYVNDFINYGLGGTIKEHNGGLDVLISALMVNNVDPISLIQFAHDRYLDSINYVQSQYTTNIASYLQNSTENTLSAFVANFSDVIISIYEDNEKFDQWFGDSTTYIESQEIGVKNWIATLPFFGLKEKVLPFILEDGNLTELVYHDGHRDQLSIQQSITRSIVNTLKNNVNVTKQTVNNSTDAFPLGTFTNGTLLLRTDANQQVTIYRFSQINNWEVVDLGHILREVILEIENRLYSVVPDYDNLNYDVSQNVSDINYTKFEQIQFVNFCTKHGISFPYTNNSYIPNDTTTWNYYNTPIENLPTTNGPSAPIAASWQRLYESIFATPYPHLEPWKLQGYTDLPSWWMASYRNVNTSINRTWKPFMWNNILRGIVPSGKLLPDGITVSTQSIGQVQSYYYLPVNIDTTPTVDGIPPDGLLPPYWNSSNARSLNVRSIYDPDNNEQIVAPDSDFIFGDNSYNQWLWKSSSQYNYDQLIVSFKIDPMNFISKTFGSKFVKLACLDVDPNLHQVFSHDKTIFHGDIVNDEVNYVNGFNQWYIHYGRYNGYDGESSQFRTLWKSWKPQLSYSFSTAIDSNNLYIENDIFDITDKDYSVVLKKTEGFKELAMDTLRVVPISVPSKYTANRDNGFGWTVQVSTTSPTSDPILYYPTESYDFLSRAGSDTFTISKYPISQIGANIPNSFIVINYNQALTLNTPTSYLMGKNYNALFVMNYDILFTLNINGSDMRTVGDVINYLNSVSPNDFSAYLDNGNLTLQSMYSVSAMSLFDNGGLFQTLSSTYSNIGSFQNTGVSFQGYFVLNGNVTNMFLDGSALQVVESSVLNGTYTIKSSYYDVNRQATTIYVNETPSIPYYMVDGSIIPVNGRPLPVSWQTGTEVYLSSSDAMPSPFDNQTPYYLIRLDDFDFKLSNSRTNAIANRAISTLTSGSGQTTISKVQFSFNQLTNPTNVPAWKRNYTDRTNVVEQTQPIYISGIQNLINFVEGYGDYLADNGFVSKNTDGVNVDPSTGIEFSWQNEVSKLISNLYSIRTSLQVPNIQYPISVDFLNNRFTFSGESNNFLLGQAIHLSATNGAQLPDPLNDPMKQYVNYFMIPSLDGNGFQVALSYANALNGTAITFSTPGNGQLQFTLATVNKNSYPSLIVNPFRNNVWIQTPQGILSSITDDNNLNIYTKPQLYDQNYSKINKNQFIIFRDDSESRLGLTGDAMAYNVTAKLPSFISGMKVFVDSYENIIFFNDYSTDNSLIYDSFLGLRTPRFYVEFNKRNNYKMRPNAGGFVLNNGNLTQNIESAVNDLRYLYDTYTVSETKPIIQAVRKSLGYDGPEDYMQSLNINRKTDFSFWRGMIKNKGTNLAINAYVNQKVFSGADLDEFWAYKVATFGDVKPKTYPEIKLRRSDSVKKEFRAEFVNPQESPLDLSFNPIAITDNSRWNDSPDVINSLLPEQSFYFGIDVIKQIENAENFIITSQVLTYLNLPVLCDGAILSYWDAVNNKVVILTSGVDYSLWRNNTIRFLNPQNVPTYTNLTVSMLRYNYEAHNPCVLRNLQNQSILKQIPIFNPIYQQYHQESYGIVDMHMVNDPAFYNLYPDAIAVSQNKVWASEKIGTVWFDSSHEDYLPFNDSTIYSTNDQIFNWGKLSDWGDIKLYQWTESVYSPSDYVKQQQDGTPMVLTYQNLGTADAPVWQLLKDSTVQVNMWDDNAINAGVTATPGWYAYINGVLDITIDFSQYTVPDYINGVVPGQSALNTYDVITFVQPSHVPTSDELKNNLYKFDTPYTIINKINPKDGSTYYLYYFWVTRKSAVTSIINNTSISLIQAEKNLKYNPDAYAIIMGLRYLDDGYGIIYGASFDDDAFNLPARFTKLVVKGLSGIVGDDDNYVLRLTRDYSLRDALPPIQGNYNYAIPNGYPTPLSLKNIYNEWKMFRENQSEKVDLYLWERLISALIGFNVSNEIIDYTTVIPSLNRTLYDELYDADTKFGLASDQIFTDAQISLSTVQSILNDPSIEFTSVDIQNFLLNNNFSTIENISSTMYNIYNSFDVVNVNRIYFACLNDYFTLKSNSSDFFKTSWVALDISQVASLTSSVRNFNNLPQMQRGGNCNIDNNVIVPTQPPLPSPSPTPSVTPSISYTPTQTPSSYPTPTITATITMTSTMAGTVPLTPTITPTRSIPPTSSVTPTAKSTITPTVTVTATITGTATPTPTPTLTINASVTPTASITPTASLTPSTTMTPTFTQTGTPAPTTTITPTITPTVTQTPTISTTQTLP